MGLEFSSGILTCTQVSLVLVLSVFSIKPQSIYAQSPAPTQSPNEVLQTYLKMDVEGGRLTAGGWYQGAKYFVKPARWEQYRSAVVVFSQTDPYPDRPHPDHPLPQNGAYFSLRCTAIGQIDSAGSFTYVILPSLIDLSGRRLKRQPGEQEVRGPTTLVTRSYRLVQTETHWEIGQDRQNLREVTGPPTWRLEHFEYQPWITIQTAIRYLTQLRNKSSDEKVRNNADKSVAILRRLHAERK